MERDEVTKYKDLLIATLKLRGDYDDVKGPRRKVLLVEGATDLSFIEHIKNVNTLCLSVVNFINSRNATIDTPPLPVVSRYSSKGVITAIIKHMSFPSISVFPLGAEKWPLFGLVDNDFSDSNNYCRITKLFFTDTHDLETLMLSTDSNLIYRLEPCTITPEDFKAALYIAKQLSAFRKAIINNGTLSAAVINSSDGTIDFEKFIEGDKFSLVKILNYINEKMGRPLTKEKLKRIQEAILKDMKRLLDKNGFWKRNLDSFRVDNALWMDINGHDILAAIRYKNPSAKRAYSNQGTYRQNRSFEFALTAAYDYDCLKKTELYQKLQSVDLIKA